MNANELADKQAFEQGELSMWIRNETATMLRQQQAEIEVLKLQLHTTLTNRDLRTYDGKASFNKENTVKEVFNTEPVAEKTSNNGWMVSKEYMELPVGTLLYTHPAKTLTDEEITEVIKKIASNNEYVYSLYEDFEGIEFSRVGIFEFSRAILRKAQEK